MATTATLLYEGQLRCKATHHQSATMIETDAPVDNRGKGERFSPTDLLCVSLGTCIITTIGIKAADMNIDINGTTLQVQKYMLSEPRRVGKIEIAIHFPSNALISEKDKIILERVGNNCPVQKSLHPSLEMMVTYNW
jgi:putative redox protein